MSDLEELTLTLGPLTLRATVIYTSVDGLTRFTDSESLILYTLAMRSPEIVSRRELYTLIARLARARGKEEPIPRIVDMHVSRVRKKLTQLQADMREGRRADIVAEYARGYRLIIRSVMRANAGSTRNMPKEPEE